MINRILYLLIAIVILSVFGCATKKLRVIDYDNPRKEFANAMNRICLSSLGKGRLISNDKSYGFRFENRLQFDKKEWLVEISIPLYGEENLQIYYKNALKKNGKIKGSIYNKIKKELLSKSHTDDRKLIDNYFNNIAMFLELYDQYIHSVQTASDGACFFTKNDVKAIRGVCNKSKAQAIFVWKLTDESLIIEQAVLDKNNQKFSIIFSNDDGDVYRNIKASLSNKSAPIVELDLKISDCLNR